MARIDITNAVVGAQGRLGSFSDSDSASTQDLIDLFRFADKVGSTLYSFPSVQAWEPGLGDSAVPAGDSINPPYRIAYSEYDKKVYFRQKMFTGLKSGPDARYDSVGWKVLGQDIDQFGGLTSGYAAGGIASPSMPATNNIDEFSIVTDTNATALGDMSTNRFEAAPGCSNEAAYSSGGVQPGSPLVTSIDNIEKFLFASAAPVTSTSVGTLAAANHKHAGHSDKNGGSGYISGGSATGSALDVIERYPFVSDAPTTSIGSLQQAQQIVVGHSSLNKGYTSGGSTVASSIQKFTFTANSTSSVVGELSGTSFSGGAGCSSPINGFHAYRDPGDVTRIDKFPFAADTNATDTGDLTGPATLNRNLAGASSRDQGYVVGGGTSPYSNVIQRFSFYTNVNTTDIADLTLARNKTTAHQV